MEPSTLAPKQRKPSPFWIVATAVAGALGALAAIGIGGRGTYDVTPFRVELRAWPVPAGQTQLSVEPIGGLQGGHTEAGTHQAPIAFRATITGVTLEGASPLEVIANSDREALRDPRALAGFFADNGKDAGTAFGIKLALLAVGGAALAGLGVALAGMRWRRVFGAVVAGVVTVGIIGLLVQQTYDTDEFRKTCWRRAGSPDCVALFPSG